VHGFNAKPLLCQLFPMQLVPIGDRALVTLRRFCPAAAADDGSPVEDQIATVEAMVRDTELAPKPTIPPGIVPGHRRPWRDFLRVTDALGRIMVDERFPLVRRIVHGLEFCKLLGRSRLTQFEGARFAEFLSLLERSVVQEATAWFRSREPATGMPHRFFRQAAMEYLRLHPLLVPDHSWRERLRLVAAAIAFGRGVGNVPRFGMPFPPSMFADLDRPLGHLDSEVLKPLNRFFETDALSLRYAILAHPGWALTESFRSLALAYCVSMWTLRLACGENSPTRDDVIRIVMMLDRAQGYAMLGGRRHRMRVQFVSRSDQLIRLAVWYAR
jgi:hypothetical protein